MLAVFRRSVGWTEKGKGCRRLPSCLDPAGVEASSAAGGGLSLSVGKSVHQGNRKLH